MKNKFARKISELLDSFAFRKVTDMRKAIKDFCDEEGIEHKMEEGKLNIKYQDVYYYVEFFQEDDYPICLISCCMVDDSYPPLDAPTKAWIANHVNIEASSNHLVAYSLNDHVVLRDCFYFNDKDMLVDLFKFRLQVISESYGSLCNTFVQLLQSDKPAPEEKRKIGFAAYTPKDADNTEKESDRSAETTHEKITSQL